MKARLNLPHFWFWILHRNKEKDHMGAAVQLWKSPLTVKKAAPNLVSLPFLFCPAGAGKTNAGPEFYGVLSLYFVTCVLRKKQQNLQNFSVTLLFSPED